jgi:hypothetical protein
MGTKTAEMEVSLDISIYVLLHVLLRWSHEGPDI